MDWNNSVLRVGEWVGVCNEQVRILLLAHLSLPNSKQSRRLGSLGSAHAPQLSFPLRWTMWPLRHIPALKLPRGLSKGRLPQLLRSTLPQLGFVSFSLDLGGKDIRLALFPVDGRKLESCQAPA